MRFFPILFFYLASFAQSEDLTVLGPNSKDIAPDREVEAYLLKKFNAHLDRRLEKFAHIQSQADCLEWQKIRKKFFAKQIGGIPDPFPVTDEITGTLQGEGYRIEKILIESSENFHVSANLYLPDGKGPFPAVLIPCGHSHNGKASGQYQRVAILMAKNGMAALCYDPIGQGERYQIIDKMQQQEHFSGLGARKLKVPHPAVQYMCTVEHTAIGLSSILLGSNTARIRLNDGMRCIDYLQSREDILADKIGCTGNSGGGTMTSYLMALDDRIVAAAPGCYLTTFRKLIETKGAQDAEQNIFGQIAFGMDEPDYVMMRAPKPTLILAATRDSTFNIDGTWDLFRQSKEFYTRLGFPERVDMVAADAPHGFYIQQREASARFMHRWLVGEDKVIRELDAWPDPLTDEKNYELREGFWEDQDLQCSPDGQVLLMEGEISTFEINQRKVAGFTKAREEKWNQLQPAERRSVIREVIGFEKSDPVAPDTVGTIKREGYRIEKIILHPEVGIRLPSLAFIPQKPSGEATLYLHDESMATDAGEGGAIERIVAQGRTVLAVDIRGIGETQHADQSRNWAKGLFGPNLQNFFLSYLNGESFVGMRTLDIRCAADVLATLADQEKIEIIARGETAIPALHAAALFPDRISKLKFEEDFTTWEDFFKPESSWTEAINVVHGVLVHYDLPDLIRLARESGITVSP